MPRNSFVKFKQFEIQQDKCAMKVCTDACVLGAWADVSGAKRILDIGAGTGLLSLMVSQRNANALIDAVEIDENAFSQATENVVNSPFTERITVIQSAIQDFTPELPYDLIISNPPFFQNDLRSPRAGKNIAHHSDRLDFNDLLKSVDRMLDPAGKFIVLLPVDEALGFIKLANQIGMSVVRKLILVHQEGKSAFRHVIVFEKNSEVEMPVEETLFIYQRDGRSYDSAFKALLKDFYIIF